LKYSDESRDYYAGQSEPFDYEAVCEDHPDEGQDPLHSVQFDYDSLDASEESDPDIYYALEYLKRSR
jgi:hypothetical protein